MSWRIAAWLLLMLALPARGAGIAADELITTAKNADGEVVPYVLNAANPQPKYVVILFPGGNGQMNPHLDKGRVVYGFGGNFLIRGREFLADEEFATVATNTTSDEPRVQALLDDLKRRYPNAQIYLMCTSRGTIATVKLAGAVKCFTARTTEFTAAELSRQQRMKNCRDCNCGGKGACIGDAR